MASFEHDSRITFEPYGSGDYDDDKIIGFGKFKHRTPNEVACTNAGYVLWLARESNSLRISKKLVNKCVMKVAKRGEAKVVLGTCEIAGTTYKLEPWGDICDVIKPIGGA